MSFRNRLTIFFIVLVILPMVVVATVGFVLAAASEQGKTDASLSAARRSAAGLFREFQDRAEVAARNIGQDAELSAAIEAGKRGPIQTRLEALATENNAVRTLMRLEKTGRFETGRGAAVAPARSRLIDAQGATVGVLTVSVISAKDYGLLVERVTATEVVIAGPGGMISTTLPEAGAEKLPARGEVEVAGSTRRLVGFDGPGFDSGRVTVRLLSERRGRRAEQGGDRSARDPDRRADRRVRVRDHRLALPAVPDPAAATAAKQMAQGDFGVEVPTEGSDEFASLGIQFNEMARQLERRLEELEIERKRLRAAIQRVGQSFGKTLERGALLEIAVQTAVDGVGAYAGRAALRTENHGRFEEIAGEGDVNRYRDVIGAAEAGALEAGETVEAELGDAHALSHPLRAQDSGRILGMLSVARADEKFTAGERELFGYLAGQAGVSIENADLHDTVKRQAVTDELTGLFNHRRFQEVIANEVERTKRGGPGMGLIMLDIDNFKRVNDTYGHMQGDLVLREVAAVLRENSREIDEPARYGGEEMAVALPGTDLEGAYLFAERVRRSIESLDLPLLDGEGSLRVTASFGAAALTPDQEKADKDKLVAAADAALYRAKRSGKNRTVRAE